MILQRKDIIQQYCKNKKVLNLGCLSENPEQEIPYDIWLHKNIEDVAKETVGLDFNKELLEDTKKICKGRLVYASAEDFHLNEKFDVIVAGEIIEHLQNLRGFFNCINEHLKDDGVLIITTPNVFKILNLYKAIFGINPEPNQNVHVLWFDYGMLKSICEKNNLYVSSHKYITDKTIENNIGNKMIRALGSIIPQYNDSILVVCKRFK